MSGRRTSLEVDVEAAEAAATKQKDLGKVLPKLANRIASSSNPNQPSNGIRSNASSPASQSSVRFEHNTKPEREESGNMKPFERQASVDPSPPNRQQFQNRSNSRKSRSSISFKPNVELPPEVEELRSRDINPDIDSAAERALNIAASLAQLNANQAAPKASNVRSSIIVQQDEPEKRNVEGREIQQGHDQYALTYGMMLGIRVTTGRRDVNLEELSSSKSLSTLLEEQELTTADYEATTDLVFPPEGSTNGQFPTPPHKLNFTFTFKDYTPNVFRAIRSISNIEEADYMMSLAGDFNYIEFIANSKSGQFFFYSHDGRYMIKTQSKEESKLLRRMMPQYVKHLTDNPDSLLVRFYGMHRVKMKSLQSKTYFVIMSSVFDTTKEIHIKYDLKGSTVGRLTSPEACKEGAVQKDLNLIQSGRKIRLGPENIDIFYETLKSDVMFLRDLNIMDYSLLLGIHDGRNSRFMRRRSSGVVLAKSSSSTSNAPASPTAPSRASTGNIEPLKRGSPSSSSIPPPSPSNDGRKSVSNPVLYNDPVSASPSIFQSSYGGIRSAPEVNEIYFMGIIDILQLYNTNKRAENFFKGFTNDRKQLSAVDPNLYAERMLDFVMMHTDYPEIMAQRKMTIRAANLRK